MNLTQPLMLWGALAIAIPILIHIWNKEKGKIIAWAATQWLLEKSLQQHRGVRLDHLLLLLVRCLLILLLAFLLSRPVVDFIGKKRSPVRVHLAEPVAAVIENYRFELESALKNGEGVYWIGSEADRVSSLADKPAGGTNPALVRSSLEQIAREGEEVNLYIVNKQELASISAINVRQDFRLHAVTDSASLAPDFKSMKTITVLLDYRDPLETQTVSSALKALISVYNIPLIIDIEEVSGKVYDWVLTDRDKVNTSPKSLYVFSGLQKASPVSSGFNVLHLPESLQIQTSEIVRSGRLPEVLGDLLVKHYQLSANNKPLSSRQLNSLFVRNSSFADRSWEKTRKWLMVVFVCLMLAERVIALKKMV